MRVLGSIALGAVAGLLYTLSPLTAWCVVLAAFVLTFAGHGLPSSERRSLHVILAIAIVVRLAAIGVMFIASTPMHDDESVAMLSGDEAYGLSRALRARDVLVGAPVTQYDYFVVNDEYGRNSYVTRLTAIEMLFGPTPYAMRLLNMLLFTIAAILLFRTARIAFGRLPAFGGLVVMLFLPTLFYWSISLLKEPMYLFGTTVIITAAIFGAHNDRWAARVLSILAGLGGMAIVSGLRPGALTLAVLGVATGFALLVYFSVPLRMKTAIAVAGALALFAMASRPSAHQKILSALETTAKTHAGHVFTVGHAYKLLDDGFYVNPVTAAASTLTLTTAEAARYVVRAAVSFITTPWPWQLASFRELLFLPEHLIWYVMLALLPVGVLAGWRRDPAATSLLAGSVLPTSAALALTNGNIGTLLRLRGMVIPYLIWISAIGFFAALQRLAKGVAA